MQKSYLRPWERRSGSPGNWKLSYPGRRMGRKNETQASGICITIYGVGNLRHSVLTRAVPSDPHLLHYTRADLRNIFLSPSHQHHVIHCEGSGGRSA